MFEKASRLNLRFNYKGMCTTEDLWHIPLDGLDAMYQTLSAEVKELTGTTSLLTKKTAVSEELLLQTMLIKHVVETRLGVVAKDAIERKAKKQKLMSLIEDKQDATLMGKSVDELKELLNAL